MVYLCGSIQGSQGFQPRKILASCVLVSILIFYSKISVNFVACFMDTKLSRCTLLLDNWCIQVWFIGKKNHTGVFFTLWKDVPTMSLYVGLTTFLMWFTLLEYACNPNFPIEQWEKRLERCRIHSVARQRWVSSFEPSEHQWRLLSLSQTAETLIQTVAQRYHLLPSPHSSLISNRRTTNANLLH